VRSAAHERSRPSFPHQFACLLSSRSFSLSVTSFVQPSFSSQHPTGYSFFPFDRRYRLFPSCRRLRLKRSRCWSRHSHFGPHPVVFASTVLTLTNSSCSSAGGTCIAPAGPSLASVYCPLLRSLKTQSRPRYLSDLSSTPKQEQFSFYEPSSSLCRTLRKHSSRQLRRTLWPLDFG
jgi:hypothetical protein